MIIFFILLGLIFGSFMNVLIYRLPQGLSIVSPKSSCPNCNSYIKWYDNIPVISYILLKGRCRNCKKSISITYPIVEITTAQDINIYRQGHSQQVLGDREMRYKNEFVHERLFIYKDNPLKLEINHFINCVTGKVPRIVTVEHDLQSLKVALKIDELIRSSNYGQKEIL